MVSNRQKLRTHVTKEDIVAGLKELGLKKGDAVGVHSSLSSLGYVEGGADAVIDALFEVVGEEGAIVMPTYSTNRIEVEKTSEEIVLGVTWKYKILPFNPKETSCWTGTIPETFRKRKGAARSLHPTHSITSIGPKAKEIAEAGNEPSALGGWRKLLELNGYILLIGVGLDRCSSMHLAEERVQLPKRILDKTTLPQALRQKYPESEWDVGFGPYPDFPKMEEPYLKRKIIKTVKVGEATVKMARLRVMIDLFAEYLKRNPDSFYTQS